MIACMHWTPQHGIGVVCAAAAIGAVHAPQWHAAVMEAHAQTTRLQHLAVDSFVASPGTQCAYTALHPAAATHMPRRVVGPTAGSPPKAMEQLADSFFSRALGKWPLTGQARHACIGVTCACITTPGMRIYTGVCVCAPQGPSSRLQAVAHTAISSAHNPASPRTRCTDRSLTVLQWMSPCPPPKPGQA